MPLLRVLLAGLIGSAVAATSSYHAISAVSEVTHVKIHGNEAEVTREVSLHDYVEDSYITVSIDGLTRQLEDKSVRVKGVGRAEIIESSVSSRALPRESIPGFKSQMFFLQSLASHVSGEIDAARAALQRGRAQKDYVESYTRSSIEAGKMRPADGSLAPQMLSTQAMMEILTFQDNVSVEMDKKIAVATKDLSVWNARASAIQSTLDALKNRGVYTPFMVEGKLYCPDAVDCANPLLSSEAAWPLSVSSKSVEVRIHTGRIPAGEPKAPLVLLVTYLAGPARWYPEYDVRLDGDAKKSDKQVSRQYVIEVDYYAAVEQFTEEVRIQACLQKNSLHDSFSLRPCSHGMEFRCRYRRLVQSRPSTIRYQFKREYSTRNIPLTCATRC